MSRVSLTVGILLFTVEKFWGYVSIWFIYRLLENEVNWASIEVISCCVTVQ